MGPEAPQAGASDFRVGVQKKSAKILTMEAKTVKTNKRMKSSQKWLKIHLTLCPYKSGLEWTFEALPGGQAIIKSPEKKPTALP